MVPGPFRRPARRPGVRRRCLQCGACRANRWTSARTDRRRPCWRRSPPTRWPRSRPRSRRHLRPGAPPSPTSSRNGRGSSTRGPSSARWHATTSRRTRTSASVITAVSTACASRDGAARDTCAGATRRIKASYARSRDCGRQRARSASTTRSSGAPTSSVSWTRTGTERTANLCGSPRRNGCMKRALITGITGQDGRHLAEFLAGKGYQVFGLVRGQANPKAQMVMDENPSLELVEGDLQDLSSLIAAVEQVQPDEVYNLGAISFVQLSFKQPELTADITGVGVLRMLEAIRVVGGTDDNPIRFYQASSSEMFGKVRETPQNERTPFHPLSPYGAAKVFGHYTTVNYREAYGLHASSGICFNHESPRRGLEFVTRKVTNSMARITLGLQDKITLGNLDSSRDWGFAGDYVEAMWRMLQQPEPGDYVLAMGETHTNRELLEVAARVAGFEDWRPLVQQDERFMRP